MITFCYLYLVGGDKRDDVPMELDLHGIPLHGNLPENASKVVRPAVRATGGDLSVTEATLANVGENDLQQGVGMYIGEGLPPIPHKLAKKITGGEYVEMEELLPEMCTREEGEPGAKRRCPRRASDIFTWLQCFGAYVSVRGARFPEMIPELMAYMGTIIKASREYTGSEWLKYDMLFRKHAALRKETMWSVINPTIYARCFTSATRNPPRCEICLAVTHETKDCTQHDLSEGDIEGRLRSMEQTIQNLPSTPTRPNIQFSGEVCRKWNKGKCSYPYCRHTHVCSLCGGAHPAIRCQRRGRSGSDSHPAPWGTRRNAGRP